MQIFVKDTRTHSIKCNPKHDAVEKLMLKIQKRTDCPVGKQLLSIRGKPVSYSSKISKITLQELGVTVCHNYFLQILASLH